MALKPTKLRPLHDENAGNVASLVPVAGKSSAPTASVKAGASTPQGRNILRDISNKLKPLPSKPAAGTPAGHGNHASKTIGDNYAAARTGFSVLPDANLAASKPLQEASSARPVDAIPPKAGSAARIPLKNISNINNLREDQEQVSENIRPKEQPWQSASEVGETEKKIRAWAEEGIEKVHFSGKDMEALREKIKQEEMEKRVAQVLSCRTELPLLRRPPPFEPDFLDFRDNLKLDPVQDLDDEECPLWTLNGAEDADLSDLEDCYIDTCAGTVLDSFPETLQCIAEDSVTEAA